MNKPFALIAALLVTYVVFTVALLCRFSALITEQNFTSIFLIAVTGLLVITFGFIPFCIKPNKSNSATIPFKYDNTAQEAAYLEKLSLEKIKMDREHYFKLLDKAIAADDLPGVNKENIRAIFEKLQIL